MKIVVAFDKFKGSLTAREACRIACEALREVLPHAEIISQPLADGGEGTSEILLDTLHGEWMPCEVTGPLMEERVMAGYTWLCEQDVSVVEMARASGLGLLRAGQRNPLHTTTFGTGELLHAAFSHKAPVWLTVGGSATVDGGEGAATALGWKFLKADGSPLAPGGGSLLNLHSIEPPHAQQFPRIDVLCDVENPLCGDQGAARIFGPQKGASPHEVEQLEAGLERLANVVHASLGIDISHLKGGGAAGGLAAGAVAFLGAHLVSGIDSILEIVRFRESLAGADWVITGEGCFDEQSLYGKVVSGVVRAAGAAKVNVALIAGHIAVPEVIYRPRGISAARSLIQPGMTLDDSITRAPALLRQRAVDLASHMT